MASRLAWFLSLVVHISVGIAADPWLNASPAFLQLRWPGSSLLQVSVAEPALVAGTKTFFTTDSVTVLSVRNATIIDSASTATYELLFLIGDPTQAFVTTVASATLNTTGLATALGKRLESIVSDTGAKNVSEPLWQIVTAFQSSTVTCQSLASADVLSLYKSAPTFPAIRTTIPPTAAFLTFSILFRNVNEPVKLSQSLMFQVRRGVAEFLGGDFNMSYVSSSGPATTAMDSTLQVNQTFYLRLPLTADTSMQGREALANRLLFGDLTRLAAGDIAGTTRPAMFLDFIFASNELSDALKSQALAGSQPFASTLIPYVFRYMNVDPFPVGNPALPGAVADTATLLATVSEDAMNALRRKKQRFQYDPEGYTAALPKDVAYPSTINLSMDLTGVFTTTVYWANTLSQEFWLESAESTTPVSWNLFPSTSFFDDSTVSSTLPAPIVKLGNTSTPLWTLQAAAPESLDMALNFRSTDDNSTLVKVEVAVTLHSSGDAESTVTSIARPANSSSVSPLNVVVRHQSRLLRNGATDKVSKLLLHLEFGTSEVTEKSADGCAHCQQLLDWCTNESGCAPLKTCVFSVIQNPIAQLVATSSTATDTEDLSSLVNGCLTGTAASPVDVNYLMLFTSAIRCHLRRLCPLSLSSSIVLPSDIKLVWGSGKGQQRIQPAAGVSNFPATTNSPLNISLGIGNRVVCYIPVWNNATAASLETKIARSCTFAKYLGTVKANVTSNTAGATAIDIFYDGLVGPLPTLSSDSDATQPADSARGCYGASANGNLHGMQAYQSGSGTSIVTVATDSSASSNNLADAILKMVRGDQVGTKLSLEAGVNSCLPAAINNGVSSVDVNGASWRKLVNASACYSRSACPLALAPVLSSSWSSLASNYLTVGKWGISPAQKLQKLIYTGSTSSLTDIKIPLSLIRDGTTATLSSPADPDSLAMALRALIQYDDIQVTADSTASSSWTISYGHWVGSLPTFIATGTKEWTLVGYPTIVSGAAVPNDSILELVPRSSTSTASANGTSSATSSQL
ncbi:hypothetical protein PC129_g7368 [Phytophthora cactorum]|uniref:Secreted protein n=1 Tax=Phytophthora cactorum TaxID=29920 RepID=A0A8T1IC79_9STRA|nr:hypothetical protein PC114_g13716 [Phytophthora cactorum]KAG2937576.1 hypothetical protein PC117_g11624 [Phytophthora cactorum]KAG3008927.1 hypothetical protein PC119_g14085 [Phytophthora cactorum]KAG3078230.1 hypothetical protein PC122_g12766 [Phytophthora cactorum]KAG3221921.1 hypothetical protein PC129_g7368 [Phytophthora cactorum]